MKARGRQIPPQSPKIRRLPNSFADVSPGRLILRSRLDNKAVGQTDEGFKISNIVGEDFVERALKAKALLHDPLFP